MLSKLCLVLLNLTQQRNNDKMKILLINNRNIGNIAYLYIVKQIKIMKTIDNLDKQSLRDYVKLINEDQGTVKISLSFKLSQVDDNEYCAFTINGKLTIKHSLDEAISFLDGIMVACDYFFLAKIVSNSNKTINN